METEEDFFAKRYKHNNDNATTNIVINVQSSPKKEFYQLIHPYQKSYHPKVCDEPIDLTQGSTRIKTEAVDVYPKTFLKPRGRRPKIYCPEDLQIPDQNQLQGFFKDVIELQATETKQAEILKAAKSLFSKRTRTLYHWMYPNTPKQHIKLAVANSWDNLGLQEKQFYISQVLVRFGFPQCSLMVNPQLGGIKELPSMGESINGSSSLASKELQTAISSISGSSTSCEGKRRQGRPPGSKNKKQKNDPLAYKLTKDFQDDPELSKELEKFAISFDCFK